MQVMEFEKTGALGSSYGLGVTVKVASIQELKVSFRLIKEAVLGWHNERGRDCKLITFTVLAEVTLHGEIKDFFQLVHAHEAQLGPLLRSWETSLALLNGHGQPIEELRLN